jgi:hypothetical protein
MKALVLGFADRAENGTREVSARVAQRLGTPRVSFTEYLRSLASQRGFPEVGGQLLQTLGEQEIRAHGSREFCAAVLRQVRWQPGEAVVIDGVRQVELVETLRELVSPASFHLVYLDADGPTQPERLSQMAELRLDARKPAEELAEEVLRWARKAEVQDRFQVLAAEWRQAVGPLSSVTKIVQHPAYREIISLGQEVVPLMLRDLEHGPDHWFAALRTLTGADPVAPEDRGRMERMAAAWVRWGREHGYTW